MRATTTRISGDRDEPQTERVNRYDAFISYARADNMAASGFSIDRLRDRLHADGHDVWVDVEEIPGGAIWRERVRRGIEACNAFIFIVTPTSVESEYCRQELEDAFALHKLIVPVLFCDVDPKALPPALAEVEWVFLREGDDEELGVRRLTEALGTDLEWRDQHTRVAGRAREWLDSGRDDSYLLRGADLRAAESWHARQGGHREAPTREQGEYIARSRHAASRRQRALVAGLTVGFVVAVGLAVFALIQRQDAIANQHIAESRALAAEAVSQLDADPELAVLLALDAVKAKQTPEAVLALRQAVGADQLRRVLLSNGGRVWAVKFDPTNPDILASASDDGSVRLWDVLTGRRMVLWHGGSTHPHYYRSTSKVDFAGASDLAFNARGTLLAQGFLDGTVHVWSLRTLRPALPVLTVPHRAQVLSVSFHGSSLVASTAAGQAVEWSTETGSVVTVTLAYSHPLDLVNFSPDGNSNVQAFDDGLIALNRGNSYVVIGGDYRDTPSVAAFSPNGKRIVAAWNDGGARLWTSSGHPVATLAITDPSQSFTGSHIETAAFSPDSTLVAVGYFSGTIGIFDTDSGRLISIIHSSSTSPADSLAFVSPVDYLVAASLDGTTRLWNPYTGQQLALLADGQTPVIGMAISADGTRLATGYYDGTVRIWEPLPGHALYNESLLNSGGFPAAPTPDRRSIVASNRGTLVLRDVASARPIYSLGSFPDLAGAPFFSARRNLVAIPQTSGITVETLDGSRRISLAESPFASNFASSIWQTASYDPDGSRLVAPTAGGGISVWSTSTGRILWSFRPKGTNIRQALFSPDGRLIASAGTNGVSYLLPADGHGQPLILRSHDTSPMAMALRGRGDIAFSPDGRLLATAELGVQLWNTRTGRQVGPGLPDDGIFVAFAPDGHSLVTDKSGAGVTVVVPVSDTGFRGSAEQFPTGDAVDAAFAPGNQLIVGSLLGGVTMYDIRTGEIVERFGAAHTTFGIDFGSQALLSWSSSGSTLYACDACGSAAQVERTANSLLVRHLTPAELKRYVRGA